MNRAYLRLFQSRPRDLRRARWITLGGALALWILLAFALGLLVPRSVFAVVTKDRHDRSNAAAGELHEYLADRLAALRFAATIPPVGDRGPGMDEALRRFNDAYPEFSEVYVADHLPSGGLAHALYLAAPLPSEGFVVGTLKPDWTEGRFTKANRFEQNLDGSRTALVTRSGPRSGTDVPTPDWTVLQRMADQSPVTLRWGDGRRYVTSVSRLDDLPSPRPTFLVVSATPVSVVAAKIAHSRRVLFVVALVMGLATGGVGCVVLGWATRWLRRANRDLELRVAERTAELQAAERSFRGIFENAPLGLYQCEPDGRFMRVNPTFAQILGFKTPEAAVAALGSLQAVGEPSMRVGFIEGIRAGNDINETTTVVTRPDGRTVWLAETARALRDDRGALVLIEGALSDVTAQRELELQLRRMGETDPLTGLLNRRGLEEALKAAEAPVSFVALDVDRFKDYNDSYGHPAGDHALRTVAEALRLTVRGNDAVARAGGEEFVVVLPHTGEKGALRVAEALRMAVQACGGLEIRLTVSGGVATATTREEIDEAFAAADRALYMAKEAGRNRIVVNPVKLA